jgi:hypothetical protein
MLRFHGALDLVHVLHQMDPLDGEGATYTVAMLLFNAAGFALLYAPRRGPSLSHRGRGRDARTALDQQA